MPEALFNDLESTSLLGGGGGGGCGGLSPTLLDDLRTHLRSAQADLTRLALDIHARPELAWEETYAHDRCAGLMETYGFRVERRAYGLSTAWVAEYEVGEGGRTIGFNSEMDALKGLGHACGHNLIAMAGCGAAIATAKLLERRGIPGKVVLLGTPAEEAGGGKCVLLDRGAYDGMDACLMVHPGTKGNGTGVGTTNCIAAFRFKYKGASAHAAGAPEKGINALDAAVAAYVNVSMLRQQTADKVRMHGTIKGCDRWSSNVIASEADMIFALRAPTSTEVVALLPKFLNCFKAAALSTGCELEISREHMYMDVNPSEGLEAYFNDVSRELHGGGDGEEDDEDGAYEVRERQFVAASTDFGNVGYHLPALHPMYMLPEAGPLDFPHSGSYAGVTNLESSIRATNKVALAIAAVGARIVIDRQFRQDVRERWEAQMKACDRDGLLKRIRQVHEAYPEAPGGPSSSGCCGGHDEHRDVSSEVSSYASEEKDE